MGANCKSKGAKFFMVFPPTHKNNNLRGFTQTFSRKLFHDKRLDIRPIKKYVTGFCFNKIAILLQNG